MALLELELTGAASAAVPACHRRDTDVDAARHQVVQQRLVVVGHQALHVRQDGDWRMGECFEPAIAPVEYERHYGLKGSQ